MQYGVPFAPHYGLSNGVLNQALCPVDSRAVLTVELARLQYEKEILENGLTACVTYLHILRKKQARNERLLKHDSLSTRKRKKKMQQSKRELGREIKNRLNDERAFLGALQACKANMYTVEGLPYTRTDISSTLADCTSSTTQYSCDESEPAEISWTGWTEDATSSPFKKRRSNPLFVSEVAPDEAIDPEHDVIVVQDIRRPPPLVRNAKEMVIFPVPPNTADSIHRHCSLSAEAPNLTPTINPPPYTGDVEASPTKTDDHAELKGARRYTEAGITRAFQELSIDAQSSLEGRNTWCNSTPQRSPRGETTVEVVQRRRPSIV